MFRSLVRVAILGIHVSEHARRLLVYPLRANRPGTRKEDY
jgi:hypothetical protein